MFRSGPGKLLPTLVVCLTLAFCLPSQVEPKLGDEHLKDFLLDAKVKADEHAQQGSAASGAMAPGITRQESAIQAATVDQEKLVIERLAALGKLWISVKYFHPWLAYKDIDWDAAFLTAVPQVQAAKAKEEYAAAVRKMLAALEDPCTYLAPASQTPRGGETVPPSFQTTEDGILTVTLGTSLDSVLVQQTLARAFAEASKAKAIVFDMRGFRFGAQVFRLATWSPKTFETPGIRTRLYSGYPAPDGSGSGGYYSAFTLQDGTRGSGNPKAPDRPIVLLVNRDTALSTDALGMQTAGLASIIVEGSVSELSVTPRLPVTVTEGLTAVVRTGEIIYADGTAGVVANKTVVAGGLEAALDLARTGNVMAAAHRTVPASASPRLDSPYADTPYPSEAHRALAAVRIWGIYNYFHPYKSLAGENWDGLLMLFLPRMVKAGNALEYNLAVAEMVARSHDTHCFVSSSVLRDFYGAAPPPLLVRWIEDRLVITKVLDDPAARDARLVPGDIVLKVGGRDVKDRIQELSPYVAASTPQALMWRVTSILMNGAHGSTVVLGVQDAQGTMRDVSLPRNTAFTAELNRAADEPIRLINENIGYVDLSRLPPTRVDEMFEKFKNTRAFIMDMRGYPQGTAWSIAPRLTDQDQPVAAQFRRNLVTAGNIASYYFEQRLPSAGTRWRYHGQTVMLIDERAISQSEHSGLFYRTANNTRFIGSATNGANGDVTWFWVPGGIRVSFTGHDVRHADGKQLQRVGLQPDIEVKPTIAGIRAGRDEVLEKAIEYLSGNIK